MTKEFQKLLENDLLSPDVKKDIKEALESAQKSIREELEVTFAKKLVKDKADMNIKLVSLIDENVKAEVEELREDIAHARTQEVRYAKLLENFKAEYAEKMNKALNETIGALVAKEFKELRGDIFEAKKTHVFGKIMETFGEEFQKLGLTQAETDIKEQLAATSAKLVEAQNTIKKLSRDKTLEGLLSNLQGKNRKVMETILENVAEDKLEIRYNECIKSVLTEEATPPSGHPELEPTVDGKDKTKEPTVTAAIPAKGTTVPGSSTVTEAFLRKFAGNEK